MAIRLADTARPNNFIEGEQQGTFPVAYAEDIWFADGTRLSEKTFGGDSIQVDELPVASETEAGHVYQYLGDSGTYEHGCFYECVENAGVYSWKELHVIKNPVTYNADNLYNQTFDDGSVVCYTGSDVVGLKHGYTYIREERWSTLYLYRATFDSAYVELNFKEQKEVAVGDVVYTDSGTGVYKAIGYISAISSDECTLTYFKTGYTQRQGIPEYISTKTNVQVSDWWELSGGGSGALYADNPIGSIVPYGGTTAPSGWLTCNGRAVNRSTYKDLFDVIGTSYGAGDGSTTFNLPDLSQLKQDYSVKTQLDTWKSNLEDGSESHTITIDKDGSYYFEIVLSNAYAGKDSNNITITKDNNVLVSSWGYIGVNAQLTNKTIFLKRGTYTITHICQTAGIGGTSVVTVYSTRNEPVGSYIIKAKHTPIPADFMDAVDEAMNECKIVPYNLNRSSNVSAFNRKWLVTGDSIVWTATHTGRLTIRCLKHGDGYSLYLTNQNGVMLDSYDNFFGDTEHGLTVTEASITLQGWVRKGDTIELSTNLPANTDWADKYFVQTGLLLYNIDFD